MLLILFFMHAPHGNQQLSLMGIFADLLQVDETTCIKPACSSQLAASLLITCNRLVIIKPERAMRTHPDIDLTGDLIST